MSAGRPGGAAPDAAPRPCRSRCAATVALFLAGLLLLGVPVPSALSPLLGEGVKRVALSAALLGAAALMGARGAARPSAAGVRAALREGCYPVVLVALYCSAEVAAIVPAALRGELALSPDWVVSLAEVVVLCASVGVFEESLFRLLLLGGLLSRFGGTRTGVVVSAVASSAVFGMAHVMPTALGGADALALAQMLLKTAQAGCLGLLFAGVFVRTRSLWGVALLHCLVDLLLMAPAALVGLEVDALGGYVLEGGDASAVALGVLLVVAYSVALVAFAPAAARGMGLLEGASVPEPGPFSPGWEPREAGDDGGRALPVPPERRSAPPRD